MTDNRPIIGITMGDAAGIGPEIIAKSLIKEDVYTKCKPIVIGDARVIHQGCNIAKKDLKINALSKIKDAQFKFGTIDVLDLSIVSPDEYEFGRPQKVTGRAAGESIKKAIELACSGEIHGVTTCPIHKDAFKMAGFPFAGHTEMFGELTGTKDYRMMLVHGDLRIIHNTAHVSLRQAIEMVKKPRLLKTIELAYQFGKRLGLKNPKIAVSGLNPHCGEEGMFGDEEIKEIIPAIREAAKEGINIYKEPVPADTIFAKASAYHYDIIVAMYHDQGHIPVKINGFKWDKNTKEVLFVKGVNVTVGLPIIRTSVDHGVAFGKAGKGLANHESLLEALFMAVSLASHKGV